MLFCPTCSSPIFGAFTDKTRPLGVVTGALDNIATEPEVVRWNDMGFVADTLDGGASLWLRNVNVSGPALKCFQYERRGDNAKEVPEEWYTQQHTIQSTTERNAAVSIRCKCHGVHFLLRRGDYENMSADDLPWNVDPDSRKLKAELCGRDSCRLQNGTDVFYWTFAEMKNISFAGDNDEAGFPLHMDDLTTLVDQRDPRIGSLTYYQSSARVHRYFCRDCSATIFYANSNRPRIIDIAVGVLEAKEGARAEGMLAWSFGTGVGTKEDANGGWRQGVFERIAKAVEEYGKKQDSMEQD